MLKHPTRDLTIDEIVVTKAQFARLPKPHREFVLASSAAANDFGISWRLLIMAMQDAADERVNAIVKQIYLRLARRLIAEVHEFRRVAKRLHDKICRYPDDERLIGLCREFLERMEGNDFLSYAEDIRHEITNHYQGPALDLHLAQFPDDHEFTMYLHHMSGNSSYIFAEEIGVFGPIRKKPSRDIDTLINWSHDMSGRAMLFQQEAVSVIFDRFIPELRVREFVVPAETDLFFDRTTRLPIFYRMENGSGD